MSDFEDRVRRGLRVDVRSVDAEALLRDVHRGAAHRRRRRTVGALVASVLVLAGVAGVTASLRGDERAGPAPVPPTPSPTQSPLPAGAPQGVVDVAVVSADRWFRLTMNIGCVGCSTVWRNDQSAEGGWERLHDFQGTSADFGGPDDTGQGPLAHLVMASDRENGWAWGSRLWSTHDGGKTWTLVSTGPGRGEGGSIELAATDSEVWALRRTGASPTTLWRSALSIDDDWTRVDPPDLAGVTGLLTLSDTVLLETSDEGLSSPRLQYLLEGGAGAGFPWNEVSNPCPGENRAYAATSVAYLLCRSSGGATAYRLVGVEHPVAGEPAFQWYRFGRSTGVVTAVHPIDDRRLLLVGEDAAATLLTDDGDTVDAPATAMTVDLLLAPGEETGTSASSGDLVLVTTFDDDGPGRLLASTDGGLTWRARD